MTPFPRMEQSPRHETKGALACTGGTDRHNREIKFRKTKKRHGPTLPQRRCLLHACIGAKGLLTILLQNKGAVSITTLRSWNQKSMPVFFPSMRRTPTLYEKSSLFCGDVLDTVWGAQTLLFLRLLRNKLHS